MENLKIKMMKEFQTYINTMTKDLMSKYEASLDTLLASSTSSTDTPVVEEKKASPKKAVKKKEPVEEKDAEEPKKSPKRSPKKSAPKEAGHAMGESRIKTLDELREGQNTANKSFAMGGPPPRELTALDIIQAGYIQNTRDAEALGTSYTAANPF